MSFNNYNLSFLTMQGADISSIQHQQMILWLGEMSRMFQFCPETFALGVCVLNRLLSTVKVDGCHMIRAYTSFIWLNHEELITDVLGCFFLSYHSCLCWRETKSSSFFIFKAQPKYLKCIAFTSLVLAAKINEEDEVTFKNAIFLFLLKSHDQNNI